MKTRTDIKELQLEDGAIIRVEASVYGGDEDVLDIEQILPFKVVTDTIENIADSIQTSLEKVKPDKASLEFGVEVGIESGALTALLVKGTGKGNLKITLEWGQG